ncbi:hypothetical protein Tco_0164317 [Tanacetum coccineum]
MLRYQMTDTPYSISLNTPYRSVEYQDTVLSSQNTPYCLEEQIRRLDCKTQYVVLGRKFDTSYPSGGYGVSVIFVDTEYVDKGICRIRNWSNAFSYEVLALIRCISLVGYGVLIRNQQSSNIFVSAPNYAPFSLSSQNTPELLHLSTLK